MKKTQTNSKVQEQWDLGLLYQSPQDPQIEKDLKEYRQKRKEFAQNYQKRTDYLTDESKLFTALKEYEQLLEDLNGARPLMYFHYLTSIHSGDHQAQAKLNKITTQLTKAQNQLTFFPIKLGKIDPAYQERFLKSSKLKRYHYLLQRRFQLAKYDLKEEQEKIINLTDQTSHQMWVKGVERTVNQKTVKFKGGELPLSAALQKIPELPDKERQTLHANLLTTAREVQDFAENEINAVVTYKQIEDELRGFSRAYQSTVLHSENVESIVLGLADSVTKNFDLAHRFYQIKAKLLGKDTLTYADRSAKLDDFDHHYQFEQASQIVSQAFSNLDQEFVHILHSMLNKGQIDVFPRQAKVSGAFCSSSINNPTYVLLNHTDDFNSVTTFAHEMGHAIHSELSKSQPVIYEKYSTSTAETASTFFEQFVFEELIKDFKKEEKIAVLHNRIQDDINTVFRQIALFNFERELHQAIKASGYLNSQQIGELLNKHTSAYLGKLFELTELDGSFFILWSHIRYFFYTYTYAYGHLISKVLVKKTKETPDFISKVKQFLSAGGSKSPKNIFADIGIDIAQPRFFQEGLKQIEQEIEELEAMVD